jgi:hypothetical protein
VCVCACGYVRIFTYVHMCIAHVHMYVDAFVFCAQEQM